MTGTCDRAGSEEWSDFEIRVLRASLGVGNSVDRAATHLRRNAKDVEEMVRRLGLQPRAEPIRLNVTFNDGEWFIALTPDLHFRSAALARLIETAQRHFAGDALLFIVDHTTISGSEAAEAHSSKSARRAGH